MPTAKVPAWKPVEVVTTYAVTGGRLSRGSCQTLTVKEVRGLSGRTEEFFKLSKGDAWLYKSVCGPNAVRGTLGRTTVVETLRRNLLGLVKGRSAAAEADAEEAAPARAGAGAPAIAGETPAGMDTLAPLETPQKHVSARGKRPSTAKRPFSGDQTVNNKKSRADGETWVDVVMPRYCPEVHPASAGETSSAVVAAQKQRTLGPH